MNLKSSPDTRFCKQAVSFVLIFGSATGLYIAALAHLAWAQWLLVVSTTVGMIIALAAR